MLETYRQKFRKVCSSSLVPHSVAMNLLNILESAWEQAQKEKENEILAGVGPDRKRVDS